MSHRSQTIISLLNLLFVLSLKFDLLSQVSTIDSHSLSPPLTAAPSPSLTFSFSLATSFNSLCNSMSSTGFGFQLYESSVQQHSGTIFIISLTFPLSISLNYSSIFCSYALRCFRVQCLWFPCDCIRAVLNLCL